MDLRQEYTVLHIDSQRKLVNLVSFVSKPSEMDKRIRSFLGHGIRVNSRGLSEPVDAYEIPVQLPNKDILAVDRDALLRPSFPLCGFYFTSYPDQIVFGHGLIVGTHLTTVPWSSKLEERDASVKSTAQEIYNQIIWPNEKTLLENFKLLTSDL